MTYIKFNFTVYVIDNDCLKHITPRFTEIILMIKNGTLFCSINTVKYTHENYSV